MSMMGELTYFLGFNVRQGESGTFLNQTKYTRDLIKRFGFEGCKSMNTPMSPSVTLDRDETGKPVDSKTFRGMIGSIAPPRGFLDRPKIRNQYGSLLTSGRAGL